MKELTDNDYAAINAATAAAIKKFAVKGYACSQYNPFLFALDISRSNDAAWARIEPLLPGRRGQWGGIARDNRRFVNAVLWIVRTGAPWRDLPRSYGGRSNTHRRFIRWCDAGVWERILEAVVDDPDMEWLMVDATYVKAHRHAAGAAGGTEGAASQRGAEHENTSGRGFTWSSAQSLCHCGYSR